MTPVDVTGYFSPAVYSKKADLCTDIVILKLREKNILEEIDKWKALGRKVYVAVSLTKGEFQEYFLGQYDDNNHDEEIQRDSNGNKILHGPGVPYTFPTLSYLDFLLKKIHPCISKNIDGIVLTEAFLSLNGGYCKPFKNEWESYYKTPVNHLNKLSVSDRFKRNHLKEIIVNNAISYLSYSIREYSYNNPYYEENGHRLKIIVQIKSLMSSKKDYCIGSIGRIVYNNQIDGFIGKPVKQNQSVAIFEGHKSNKLFEISFLAYSYFSELYLKDNKEIWLPIVMKDKDFHTDWSNSIENFKTSLIASIMTIKNTKYLLWGDSAELYNRSFLQIPPEHSAMIHVAQNALKSIYLSMPKKEFSDEPKIGIIVGDSIQYQNGYPEKDHYAMSYQEDIEYVSAFYGLALPFLNMGITVTPVPEEQINYKDEYINDYNVLILSYEFFTPDSHSIHYVLKEWVRTGGILIIVGNDENSYNYSDGWWKHSSKVYSSPLDHFLDVLNIKSVNSTYKKIKTSRVYSTVYSSIVNTPAYEYDEGLVAYLPVNPILFAREPDFRNAFTRLVLKAAEKKDIHFNKKEYMTLKRGEYRLYHINNSAEPLNVKGRLIDLFSPKLDYINQVELHPGQSAFYFDIDEKKSDEVGLIAIGASVFDYESTAKKISFTAKSPEGYTVPCRLYFPYTCTIFVNKQKVDFTRDISGDTVYFEFDGKADGNNITVIRL